MVVGWGLVWHFAKNRPRPEVPEVVAAARPEPIVADRSVEFETVTDRTPREFRDNAAYALLLDRARGKSPDQLAAIARRDVVLAHLWQNPGNYRGVPIHLLGTARRVVRFPSQMSKTGWLYEAWISPADTPLVPYACVFEDAPAGLPIGADVSERVVFNGYFLKIMKYQASDASRGTPVLIGRIGWEPRETAPVGGENSTLRWSLIAIGVMFFVSLLRWGYQLYRLFTASPVSPLMTPGSPVEEIDPGRLDDWVHSMAPEGEHDDPDES
jgi:hypothetical protein